MCIFAAKNNREMAKTVIVKIPNVTEEVRIGYSFNEHSQSPNGYVFSQYLEREGVIDLCIADTGITVAMASLHRRRCW